MKELPGGVPNPEEPNKPSQQPGEDLLDGENPGIFRFHRFPQNPAMWALAIKIEGKQFNILVTPELLEHTPEDVIHDILLCLESLRELRKRRRPGEQNG